MKQIYLFLIVGAFAFGACDSGNQGGFAERDDQSVATDPEDYERGMREEEGSPEKEEPLVDEEPDSETTGE